MKITAESRVAELRRIRLISQRYYGMGLNDLPDCETINLRTESNDLINESRPTELMRSAEENDELTVDILPVDQRLEILTLEQIESDWDIP